VVNALNHPNIVRIIDFVDEEGRPPYVVMEYLEGDSLVSLLAPDALLRLDACFAITRQIADAMATVHDQGLVHRDLKPDNVFVERRDGGVSTKLVDFGLAKFQLDNNVMLRTQTGSIVGTPRYMAPEQIRGQQVDHRCDIYAMGCTLYALLTGEPPFTDDKVGALLRNHLYEPPVPPSACVSGARRAAIPPELERATLRCLAKEPELRLQSMRELVEVLDAMGPPSAFVSPPSEVSPAPTPTPIPTPTPTPSSLLSPSLVDRREAELARIERNERNRQTQKLHPLTSHQPSRWWYGTVAMALVLVGVVIAVWVGRLSRSGESRTDRPNPPANPANPANNGTSGYGMATMTHDHQQQPRHQFKAGAQPGTHPSGMTRRIRVLTLPPGASLVNPRTGQILWRTTSAVSSPSRPPPRAPCASPYKKRPPPRAESKSRTHTPDPERPPSYRTIKTPWIPSDRSPRDVRASVL